MPIFVSHVTLTSEGVQAVKNVHERLEENRKLWEDAGGKLLHGVGARMLTRARPPIRSACHRPMRNDAGRPSSIIRFRMLHASTASRRCPAGLRARRLSPRIDL